MYGLPPALREGMNRSMVPAGMREGRGERPRGEEEEEKREGEREDALSEEATVSHPYVGSVTILKNTLSSASKSDTASLNGTLVLLLT